MSNPVRRPTVRGNVRRQNIDNNAVLPSTSSISTTTNSDRVSFPFNSSRIVETEVLQNFYLELQRDRERRMRGPLTQPLPAQQPETHQPNDDDNDDGENDVRQQQQQLKRKKIIKIDEDQVVPQVKQCGVKLPTIEKGSFDEYYHSSSNAAVFRYSSSSHINHNNNHNNNNNNNNNTLNIDTSSQSNSITIEQNIIILD